MPTGHAFYDEAEYFSPRLDWQALTSVALLDSSFRGAPIVF